MADEQNDQQDESQDDGQQQQTSDLSDAGKKAIREERQNRRAAEKRAAEAETQLEQLRKASQSDQEKLIEQARTEAAEQAAKPLAAKLARYEVALTKGLSVDDLDFIHGETPEEIAASADKFLERIGARQQEQKPSFNGGPRKAPEKGADMNNQIRRMAGLG
jgi:hypothetical protein